MKVSEVKEIVQPKKARNFPSKLQEIDMGKIYTDTELYSHYVQLKRQRNQERMDDLDLKQGKTSVQGNETERNQSTSEIEDSDSESKLVDDGEEEEYHVEAIIGHN